MPIKAKRKVVFLKAEGTYGTDSTPAAATDALLVHNFSYVPLEMQYEERDPALPFFGNQGQVKAGDMVRMEFDIEIAGAGAVAAAPKFGPALIACAMAETITPTTGPVTYSPISSGEGSVTAYFYWDGLLHKMVGARGTEEYRFSEGRRPMIHCTLVGLYGGVPTDAALPVPVLTGFQTPLTMTKANLPTFTLHGYAAPLRELTLTGGKVMTYHNRPNQESVIFVDRKTRGSVTIELPLTAVKDFYTICRNMTLGALALVHGTTAGNKALIDAANVQLTNPRYTEADGIGFLQMGMEVRPSSAGNDEYTFKTQ